MVVVRDIMQTDIVTVPSDMNARQLARKLADEDISGVPVTDGDGELAGVVSQTDLVRLAARGQDVHFVGASHRFESRDRADLDGDPDGDADAGDHDPFGYFLPEESAFSAHGLLDAEPQGRFDTTTVAEIMTSVSYSVTPDMPVQNLADYLARGRIQRAVVVENGRLVGIVTAIDVLRAVAEGNLLR
ncbi:MAG: CBS domain-containing protein [Gemmatimonadota bacterium]|nr:CBS domain-containing protein [Gemmatimonadota bacterium]MDE2983260.1 CBS domain-containing protein [Gemmatimonadota bacterium]